MKKCYIALGGIGRSLLEKYIDSSNSNESLYLSFDTDDSYEEKPRNNFKYIKFNKDLVASNIDEYIDSIPTFSECFCDEFFDTDNIELIVILSSFGDFGSNVVFEIIDKAVREIKGVLSRNITIGLKFLAFSWEMFKHSLPTSMYKTCELNTTKLIKRFQESVKFDSVFYPSINSTYYDYIKFFLLDSHISRSELFKIISMNDDELANIDVKNKYIELAKGLTTETYIKNGEQASPYSGSEPYIFISYSHKDSSEVNEVIKYLQHQGFRIWYDQGIDPGTEWDENIAKHVMECSYFIAFVSRNYLNSDNCKDELKYARDLNKERLIVYLEECELPPGIAMRMNRIQSIHKYKYEKFIDFGNKIMDSQNINSCRCEASTFTSEEISHKPNDAETDLSDDSFRKMFFELDPELYEATKKFEDPEYIEELFDFFEPKPHKRIFKEWLDKYKNRPKAPKLRMASKILISIYLAVWYGLCYFCRFPFWRMAVNFEDLGFKSASTLEVLSNVFWGAHVAMWALGIILIYICFLKPEKKKYICTVLLATTIVVLSFHNYSRVKIEDSTYKCTPTVKMYYCDESTHYSILQNTTSKSEMQSRTYARSEFPDNIYGEHFYLDEDFIVITKNSKDEWERFTNNMNLPEGTHALYVPTQYMRYVSVAGKYGG